MKNEYHIGIIADTHGFLTNAVHDVFQNVDLIFHAGDIGNHDVLIELKTIAPVAAVFGNMDRNGLRETLNERLETDVLNFHIVVTHFPGTLLPSAHQTIRIFGHTHMPEIVRSEEGLLINPGSASQPRGG